MFEVVSEVIGHEVDPQLIVYICCAMVPLLAVVIIDVVRGIFSSFMRG